MGRLKDKPERISMSLLDVHDKFARERFGAGLDKKPISVARFTDAIAKHPQFPSIIDDLKGRPGKK